MSRHRYRTPVLADSFLWLDVVCITIAREQSSRAAAAELGVPVEILQRWIARIEARRARKRISE